MPKTKEPASSACLFHGRHHARFHKNDVPYHIVSKVFQGRFLLNPDNEQMLSGIIAGVVGRAQSEKLWPEVKIYAFAVLSNHAHFMLSGPPRHIPAFVGYIKREVSHRWGKLIDWPGTMWSGQYQSTALPTAESQIRCLEYVLSQGVKENLVQIPEQWPGFHCARALFAGEQLKGRWLNGTAYAKAKFKEAQKVKNKRRRLDPAEFETEYEVRLSTIPAWQDLNEEEKTKRLLDMRAKIIAEGDASRRGKPPLGPNAIVTTSRKVRKSPPKPPWFEQRRRMICWANPQADETKAYLLEYWEFQFAYRMASDAYLAGDIATTFPPNCFKPPVFHPQPERNQDIAA